MIVKGSEYLTSILHALSQSMMIPVVALLLVMAAYMVIEVGGFMAEKRARKRHKEIQLLDRVQSMDGSEAWHINNMHKLLEESPLDPYQRERLELFLEKRHLDLETKRIMARELLDTEEAHYQKKLDRTELLAKIAPVLGLMGTLIPLGPGLGDLGQGNVEGLSQAMIIAFDTTVIGVAVGAAASVVAKSRRRWYQQDICRMEMLLEYMGGQEADEVEPEKRKVAKHQ